LYHCFRFCITGATPVAYQYGAEITHPAPEGTSNGIFARWLSGLGTDYRHYWTHLKNAFHNSYVPPLVGLAVLIAGSGLLFMLAKESPKCTGDKRSGRGATSDDTAMIYFSNCHETFRHDSCHTHCPVFICGRELLLHQAHGAGIDRLGFFKTAVVVCLIFFTCAPSPGPDC